MRDIIVKAGLKHGITEAASDQVVDDLVAQGFTLTKESANPKANTTVTEKSQLKVQPA